MPTGHEHFDVLTLREGTVSGNDIEHVRETPAHFSFNQLLTCLKAKFSLSFSWFRTLLTYMLGSIMHKISQQRRSLQCCSTTGHNRTPPTRDVWGLSKSLLQQNVGHVMSCHLTSSCAKPFGNRSQATTDCSERSALTFILSNTLTCSVDICWYVLTVFLD